MGADLQWELPALLAHAHLIVSHPGIKRGVLEYHLKKPFPATRQVQIKALRVTREREDSIDHLVRYPLKLDIPKYAKPLPKSKSRAPRRPDIVRYILRVYDELDGRGKKRKFEVDWIPPAVANAD